MKLSEGSSALPAPFCFTWLLNAFKPEKYTHRLGQIQYLPHRRYNKVALGVFAQLEKSSAKQMTEQLKPICMCLKKTTQTIFILGCQLVEGWVNIICPFSVGHALLVC